MLSWRAISAELSPVRLTAGAEACLGVRTLGADGGVRKPVRGAPGDGAEACLGVRTFGADAVRSPVRGAPGDGVAACLGVRTLGADAVRRPVRGARADGAAACLGLRAFGADAVRRPLRGAPVDGDWGFDFFKETSDRPVSADTRRRRTRNCAGNPVCGLQDGVERSPVGTTFPIIARSGQIQCVQCVLVENDEAVLLGSDDRLLAPSAHDADAGFNRRAGHVGQFLARQRQGNVDAAAFRPALFFGELEEQSREPRFDPASCQVGDPIGQFDNSMREAHQHAPHERRVLLEQREERLSRDLQRGGVLERKGGRRIRMSFVRGHGANRIAGAENLQNHVFARPGHLGDFDPARDDDADALGRLAFRKNGLTTAERLQLGDRGQTVAILRVKSSKHRRQSENVFDIAGHAGCIIQTAGTSGKVSA